jgi:hypothetical protein
LDRKTGVEEGEPVIKNDDDLFGALADLPAPAPDPEWESRLRARCHRELARKVSRRQRARLGARLFDLTAALAACLYLLAVLHFAARVAGGG